MFLKDGGLAVLDTDEIRSLRLARGLSQAALGQQLGRSRQRVVEYEAGSAQPDPATLMRMATFFGTTTDDLLRQKAG